MLTASYCNGGQNFGFFFFSPGSKCNKARKKPPVEKGKEPYVSTVTASVCRSWSSLITSSLLPSSPTTAMTCFPCHPMGVTVAVAARGSRRANPEGNVRGLTLCVFSIAIAPPPADAKTVEFGAKGVSHG